MNLEETSQLYASVLRQLLPTGGYDTSPNTEALAIDVYAHAKLLAQADLDGKRLLKVLEDLPPELLPEYETEYGLPLKCTVNASRTIEERLQILNWIRTSRNVLNRTYLEQILSIFGVVLIDIVKFKPLLCTAACDSPVNTEQLRYKVFLRLQYPMNADMNCIVENYLPGYLRFDWMIDMPWGEWILNPTVTVNINGIAYYIAYKTNQREYYDSYANLDLTAAIVSSLHDGDMQQWQAVKDAINQLISSTDYIFNNSSSLIEYTVKSQTNETEACGSCTEYSQYYTLANLGYLGNFPTPEAAMLNHYKEIGGWNEWWSNPRNIVCNNNPTQMTCTYDVDYLFDGSVRHRTGYVNVIQNPNYDPGSITILTLSYADIAQKIISNTQNLNQAISLLAETYVEAVANSIFNTESSKQFVKLSDLLSQFELNKTLRT
ncbi:hypothetical protein QAC21B_00109 [Acinetobacter bohemicus]|nr:hypothetical protein QAC21B_00109 [Acinetobacter bohemicus]